MNDGVDQDFINKLVNYLETKQHKKLQLEVKLLGKIEDQHPIIIFYYAVSLSSYEHLKKEEGMEYDMGNVQSVAQTIFHKATDDRAVLRAFAPKVIDGKKESEDDLPF